MACLRQTVAQVADLRGAEDIFMTDDLKDWKELALEAASEQDPDKLLQIIDQLNSALQRQVGTRPPPRRLLLVDDDEHVRLTLLPVLQESGFEAQLAASVEEAMEAMRTHQFDILISDLNLSEPEDGFKVANAMRKACPRCVVVILTGYPALQSAIQGIHAQVDDYIVKPADYDVLIDTLEKRLAAKWKY
jgi:ActR/RegA family two-component response regulator